MNELRELKAMRAEVPPPTVESVRTIRRRLTSEAGRAKRRLIPRPPALVWRTAAVGGLAAAVLLGVTVAQDGDPATPNGAAAAAALQNAAAVVARQPASITERPRPDQWAYVEYFLPGDPGSSCQGNCMGRIGAEGEPDDVRISAHWLRVDGQRDAYKLEGIDSLHVQDWAGDEYGDWTPTELWDLYVSLPRDPDRLLEAIYTELRRFDGEKPDNFDLRGDGRYTATIWLFGKLLGGNGLTPPPDLHAALFEALAKVPGLEVEEDVEDPAGRDAVLVGRVGDACASCLSGMFLDPEDYTYLGGTENYHDEDTEGWAILDRGIVDNMGDRP